MTEEAPHPSVRRMLDANLNRLAEALRVVEDVCRFHWNQPGFGAAFKRLRHDVFSALETSGVALPDLFRQRDIAGDVGRDIDSPAATDLHPESLAFRNLERAKEALRVVEECCRACAPAAGRCLQEIRYQLYAEEKGLSFLVASASRSERLGAARLYLVVVPGQARSAVDQTVSEALEGGVDIVQLRAKSMRDAEALPLARRLREVTARGGALFVINDRPDLARLAHADGVHLGQDDLPVHEARTILGEKALIGLSTHSRLQAQAAERLGVDYIGVGPAFATGTKEDHEPVLGAREAGAIAVGAGVPAFVFGGITPVRAPAVVSAGCHRIAVASAILGADEPRAAARELRALLG